MARLRKFVAYRRIERPFTRMSKYKKLNFVGNRPNSVLVKYDVGDLNRTFPCELTLISKDQLQIRHNALESARQTSTKALEKHIGKGGWKLKVNVYPHHILRENPLASGAGADRMSTGMQKSFGKNISIAARVFKGQKVFTVWTTKTNINIGKLALQRAGKKLPCSTMIVIKENK
jgi:large subunit ribosomal protein L10e